jgi:hypothetical protein
VRYETRVFLSRLSSIRRCEPASAVAGFQATIPEMADTPIMVANATSRNFKRVSASEEV